LQELDSSSPPFFIMLGFDASNSIKCRSLILCRGLIHQAHRLFFIKMVTKNGGCPYFTSVLLFYPKRRGFYCRGLIHQAHRLFFIKMVTKNGGCPYFTSVLLFYPKRRGFYCRGLIHQAHRLFFIKMVIKMEKVSLSTFKSSRARAR